MYVCFVRIVRLFAFEIVSFKIINTTTTITYAFYVVPLGSHKVRKMSEVFSIILISVENGKKPAIEEKLTLYPF